MSYWGGKGGVNILEAEKAALRTAGLKEAILGQSSLFSSSAINTTKERLAEIEKDSAPIKQALDAYIRSPTKIAAPYPKSSLRRGPPAGGPSRSSHGESGNSYPKPQDGGRQRQAQQQQKSKAQYKSRAGYKKGQNQNTKAPTKPKGGKPRGGYKGPQGKGGPRK